MRWPASEMEALLAYSVRQPGGIRVDVDNQADGIRRRGGDVQVVRDIAELRAGLRRLPDALVHVYGCLPSPTAWAMMVAAKAARRRLVWTPTFHPARRRMWRQRGALRVMEGFDFAAPHAARFTDAVVALTDEEADFFTHMGARCVRVIPPAVRSVTPLLSDAEKGAGRRDLGVGPGPLILSVGRSEGRKGLDFAAEVIAAIRRRHSDATLLLIGTPQDHRLAAVPGIVCTGWINDGLVDLAYGCADVTLVPSRYEAFSRVVIEAWAHSCPVVVTQGVALAPLVTRSGGAAVRYGDHEGAAGAIEALLADRARQRRVGAAGRAFVEANFLLDRVADQTVALYRQVLGGAGTSTDADPAEPIVITGAAPNSLVARTRGTVRRQA
jgi:glycosyltransferase involved in cell wall biosynthesis